MNKSVCQTNRQIKLFAKQIRRSFFHIIVHSQALTFIKFCYNKTKLQNDCKRILNTFTKRCYNETITTAQINRAITIPGNKLLNKVKTSNTEHLPITVTYNRTLPDLNKLIDKN